MMMAVIKAALVAALASAVLVGGNEIRGAALGRRGELAVKQSGMVMAHDAGTTYLTEAKSLSRKELVAVTKTQPDGGFDRLLQCGARALDIRVEVKDGRVIMHHGVVSLPTLLKDAIGDVLRWSSGHREELVVLYFSHFVGTDAQAKVRELAEELGVVFVEDLANMQLTAAIKAGPVVGVMAGAVDERYDPSVVCERTGEWCAHDDVNSTMYRAMRAYLSQTASSPSADKLWMIQAHWQYDPEAVALEVLHGSSIIHDNEASKINAFVLRALQQFPAVNLLELDNVCLKGAAIAAALRARSLTLDSSTLASTV